MNHIVFDKLSVIIRKSQKSNYYTLKFIPDFNNILQNPLTFFPVYLKIANQIKKMKMQDFFFSVKDKPVAAVVNEKICGHGFFVA